ncbi:phosphate ABC transporter permease PstA [Methanoplanus sp. FWC-SCC4]|uniref:Phosphate ABC transporter permease PstA n=1 Tax=Methanochimaera problematica TaxID=2609417 RepID=A0AA97FH26_9EURY|nr:phosphate ABC transporter permease PstA [Methanoplanus sp. FWC-SCC4]WOF17301.1 phosphate ABC transporter permease PstA [Methanoplanus sp. FWC-SCC4]
MTLSSESAFKGDLGSRNKLKHYGEKIPGALLFLTTIFAAFSVFFILLFLLKDAVSLFENVSLPEFLFGNVWNPSGANPSYGTMPLWTGTILVTLGAMLIATPLGIASAVYISEIASPKTRAVVKPAIELLAGIPSVVYGFFGLIVLTNYLRIAFDIPSGECWLAGSILLGIMALPTIISVSEDAISSVPMSYKQGSLGLGATHLQTIVKVLIPAASSGITAALILGMGRAIGETMAVLMVTGNAAIIPEPLLNVLSPVRTLTGTLGIEMGEVAIGSLHYHALFGVACLLLFITLFINLSAGHIIKNLNKNSGLKIKKFFKHSSFSGNKRLLLNLTILAVVLIVISVLLNIAAAISIGGIYLLYALLNAKFSRNTKQKIAFSLIYASVAIVLLVLALILYDIISNGLPAISWEFLTQSPKNLGREGGIFPAIIGTAYLVAGAVLFSLPIGIGSAVYMNEYTKQNRITSIIRTGIDLLNGTPSIVFGLFGFAFLVLYLDFGISLIVGQITLGLMILPTIIRTTEESLKSVPDSLRHGSLALGATKWQTIRKVILPCAVPGIITGTILSIGRAAGETAPIMFTAVVFSTRFLPSSPFEPVMALPYHLFILSTNVPGAESNQYGTALVLITLVILIYSAAILIRNSFQKKIQW